jgi:hypothetical protein
MELTLTHRRVASSERQSGASDSGRNTPRSLRASEVAPARKRAHTVFTLFCSAVFTVVYFAELPLRGPYWLMLVQMLIELIAQPDLDRIMQIHHLANLGMRHLPGCNVRRQSHFGPPNPIACPAIVT